MKELWRTPTDFHKLLTNVDELLTNFNQVLTFFQQSVFRCSIVQGFWALCDFLRVFGKVNTLLGVLALLSLSKPQRRKTKSSLPRAANALIIRSKAQLQLKLSFCIFAYKSHCRAEGGNGFTNFQRLTWVNKNILSCFYVSRNLDKGKPNQNWRKRRLKVRWALYKNRLAP